MVKKLDTKDNIDKKQTPRVILVVEDDEALLNLIQKRLRGAGFQTEGISKGAEAIEWIIKNSPELLIVDYRLADMTAEQVINNLVERQWNVPFIVTTGYGDEKLAVKMMKLGAEDYLVKDSTFNDRLSLSVELVFKQLEIKARLSEADEALKESEQNFRNSLDSSPLGCRIYSAEGDLLYTNQALARLYGFDSVKELFNSSKKQRLTLKGYSESQKRVQKALEGKYLTSRYEVEVVRKDGEIRHLEAFPNQVYWGGKKQTQITYQDITERKRVEEALKASEQNFRISLDESPLPISIISKTPDIIYANQAMIELLGYGDLEEMKNTPLAKRFTPEYQAVVKERWEKIDRGEFVPEHLEHEIIRTDGEIRIVDAWIKNVRWDGEEYHEVIYQDITERKRVEKEFAKSEERFSKAFHLGPSTMVITRVDDGKFIIVSDVFTRMYGYNRKNIIGQTALEIGLWPKPEQRDKMIGMLRKNGAVRNLEVEFRTKSGEIRDVLFSAEQIDIDDEKCMVAVTTDITERKQAEEELRQSNALLTAVHQAQSQFILEHESGVLFDKLLGNLLSLTNSEYGFIAEVLDSAEGKPYIKAHAITNIAWSKKTRDFYERNAPEGLEFYNLDTLFGAVLTTGKPVIANNPSADPRAGGIPEGHPPLDSFLGLPIFNSGQLVGEIGIANRPSGYNEDLVEYLQPFLSSCGTLIVAYRTEQRRRQAEEKIQRGKEYIQSILDNSTDLIFTLKIDGTFSFFNRSLELVTGYKEEELIGKPFLEYVIEEERPGLLESWEKALRGMSGSYETRIIKANGEIAHVFYSYSRLTEYGEVLVVLRDITERKKMEDALKESEEKFSQIFYSNPSPMAIQLKDSTRICDINAAFTDLVGQSSEECIGKTIDELDIWVSKQDKERLARIGREQGNLANFEMDMRSKTGEIRDVLISSEIIILAGEPYRITTIRDITERKIVEDALRKSESGLRDLSSYLQHIREEERTRIAREIHDGLGQALTAIKLNISWLSSRLSGEESQITEKTREALDLINGTIKQVRKISTELRPGVLDDLGLIAAIEWQASDFEKHTGIKCRLNLTADEMLLNSNLSTALFRVVQEALTNITRHAEASQVNISIKQNNGKIRLSIKDNGKGITERQIKDPKSLGIMGMKERIRSFNGVLNIEAVGKKGTRITADIPLN